MEGLWPSWEILAANRHFGDLSNLVHPMWMYQSFYFRDDLLSSIIVDDASRRSLGGNAIRVQADARHLSAKHAIHQKANSIRQSLISTASSSVN